MPTLLGEITSAPAGTQKRIDENYKWQTAYVDDELYEDYETRNSEDDDYGIDIYSEVEADFCSVLTYVTFGVLQGQAQYLNSSQQWVTVPSESGVQAYAVHTGKGATLPMTIQGSRTQYKRKPW